MADAAHSRAVPELLTMLLVFIVALMVLAFAGVSGRISASPFTPPMIFAGAGLLLGAYGLLPPLALDDALHLVAELTLVVVLFTDAARIELASLRRGYGVPLRLLAIAMPLTVLLGGVVAAIVFPAFGWADALLLGAILAPTDAALGEAVVTNARVPSRVRQALSVESGLNDGVALPAIMILCAFAAPALHPTEGWSVYVALQLTLGPLVGFTVGMMGGQLVMAGACSGWMSEGFRQISALALAFAAFAGAELIGGNGFIAAFVAGLTIGNTASEVRGCLYEFAENHGKLMMLLAFLLIGAVLGGPALAALDGATILYSILSLSVVRMLPVWLGLAGVGLRPPTILFLGWFGPRGLASVVFALMVLRLGAPAGHAILDIVVATVLLSIFLHGASAAWLATRFGRFADRVRTLPAPVKQTTASNRPAPPFWLHFAGRLAIPLTAAPLLIGMTEGKLTAPEIALIGSGSAFAYLQLYSELTRDS